MSSLKIEVPEAKISEAVHAFVGTMMGWRQFAADKIEVMACWYGIMPPGYRYHSYNEKTAMFTFARQPTVMEMMVETMPEELEGEVINIIAIEKTGIIRGGDDHDPSNLELPPNSEEKK